MGNMFLDSLASLTHTVRQVEDNLLLIEFTITNACIVSGLGENKDQWVLIDTGVESSFEFIRFVAEGEFGATSKPLAIILTDGHFDHAGAAVELANYYDVEVYVHPLEYDYVTGKKNYEKIETTETGFMAKMSKYFPSEGIDLGDRVKVLPLDGSIPFMNGWKSIHVPGSSPGEIALFNEDNRILIVGNAFSTVKPESLISMISAHEVISGPPSYFVKDIQLAKQSIQKLIDLNPRLAIVSHGQPLEGETLKLELQRLYHQLS